LRAALAIALGSIAPSNMVKEEKTRRGTKAIDGDYKAARR
jgi:hypothetical protein